MSAALAMPASLGDTRGQRASKLMPAAGLLTREQLRRIVADLIG